MYAYIIQYYSTKQTCKYGAGSHNPFLGSEVPFALTCHINDWDHSGVVRFFDVDSSRLSFRFDYVYNGFAETSI